MTLARSAKRQKVYLERHVSVKADAPCRGKHRYYLLEAVARAESLLGAIKFLAIRGITGVTLLSRKGCWLIDSIHPPQRSLPSDEQHTIYPTFPTIAFSPSPSFDTSSLSPFSPSYTGGCHLPNASRTIDFTVLAKVFRPWISGKIPTAAVLQNSQKMPTATQPVKNFSLKMYAVPYIGIGHSMISASAMNTVMERAMSADFLRLACSASDSAFAAAALITALW